MNISRRKLLGMAAAAGSAAILPSTAKASSGGHSADDAENQLGMLMDISLCNGCRECEKACNRQNNLPKPDVSFDDTSVLGAKRRTTAESFTVVNRYEIPGREKPVFRKIQCNHCVDPACVSACFVKALKKTPEGPVVYDKNLCVGCRYCLVACPFYIPTFEYNEAFTPRVMKCNMCYDLTVGEDKPTACAKSCPLEALAFGKRSNLLAIARRRILENPDRYQDRIYGENEIGGTNWMYISNVPFDKLDMPMDLGRTPYPDFTKGPMAAVPVIAVMWPLLLGGVYSIVHRKIEAHEDAKEHHRRAARKRDEDGRELHIASKK